MKGGKKYCPEYREGIDYLYGDYYSRRASWFRLIIHLCDPKERAKMDKECASVEESE